MSDSQAHGHGVRACSPDAEERIPAQPRRGSLYRDCFLCRQTLVRQVQSPQASQEYIPTPCDSCLNLRKISLSSLGLNTWESGVKLGTAAARTPSSERLEDIPEHADVDFKQVPFLVRKRRATSPYIRASGGSGYDQEIVIPALPTPEELGLPNQGQRYFSFLSPKREHNAHALRPPREILHEFIRYEEGLRASQIYQNPDLQISSCPNHALSLPEGLHQASSEVDGVACTGQSVQAIGGSAIDLTPAAMDSTLSLLEKHCVGSPQNSPRLKRHSVAGMTQWTPTSGLAAGVSFTSGGAVSPGSHSGGLRVIPGADTSLKVDPGSGSTGASPVADSNVPVNIQSPLAATELVTQSPRSGLIPRPAINTSTCITPNTRPCILDIPGIDDIACSPDILTCPHIPLMKLESSEENCDALILSKCDECGERDHATNIRCSTRSALNNNNNTTNVPKNNRVQIILPHKEVEEPPPNRVQIILPHTDNEEYPREPSGDTLGINPSFLSPWHIFHRRDSSIDDLDQLKAVTARLQLDTRRESYVTWRENYVEKPYLWRHRIAHSVVNKQIEDDWSEERIGRINEAITWMKRELLAMRTQDQELARRLITLRKDISEFRLARSVAEHREIIEEAVEQEEEKRDDLAELNDAPPDQFCSMLKEFGVTRLNINSRRFSVF